MDQQSGKAKERRQSNEGKGNGGRHAALPEKRLLHPGYPPLPRARTDRAGQLRAWRSAHGHDVGLIAMPGPIVLVSSAHGDQTNIMTMGWHMVMEFSPSLVACLISSGN